MPHYIFIPYDAHKTNTKTPFISQLIQVGDFSVGSNLDSTKINLPQFVFQNVLTYTLDDINKILPSNSQLTSDLPPISQNINPRVNKKKLSTYLKYSAVQKHILFALDYIYVNFPAALICSNNINGKIGQNILNSSYDAINNKTRFVLNTNFISNPLDINYLNVELPLGDQFSKYRALRLYFEDYVLELNSKTYNLTDFQGSDRFQNSYISLEITGNPFNNGNNSVSFVIKPGAKILKEFSDNAPLLVNVLLSNEHTDGFYTIFEDKILPAQGNSLIYELTFILPKADLYNPDLRSAKFTQYKTDLLAFAEKEDLISTNVLERKYIEPNLLLPVLDSFDQTDNQSDKFDVLLSVYAASFDERQKFINALKNTRVLSYDGQDNISDDLLDLYINSFGININKGFSIEKKREFGLNFSWLIKSKGTRKEILYLFEFLNIPLDLVQFSEYVKTTNTVNVPLLQYYYDLVYGNADISKLSVDSNGNPKSQSNYIFEDNDYWNQFYVLDDNLNGKFFTQSKIITSQNIIYNNSFESSGTTFEYLALSSNCYDIQSSTTITTGTTVDECGCEILTLNTYVQISGTPHNLYTGCTNPVLDIWQECIGVDQILMHLNAYGGTPPYTFSGTTSGTTNDEILPSNQYFDAFVIDANGCQSELVTGTTFCYNVQCIQNPIIVSLTYICNLDQNSQPDGTATAVILFSGGTAPYIVHGNQDGDVLNNGETIITEVTDVNGCSSGILSDKIMCPRLLCDNLILDSTAECTANLRPSNTLVNVTYDLQNIPNTTLLHNVLMTITQVSGGNIYGNPVTEIFYNASGAKTIGVDFGSALGTITFTVDLIITLENGCQYTDSYQMAVDCHNVNTPVTHHNTLIAS